MAQRSLYRLTAADVKNAAIGETLYDGGGLECTRTSASAVQWVYRYTSPVTRKRRSPARTGLSLKAARTWADEQRDVVRSGSDPLLQAEQRAASERATVAAAERQEQLQAATLLNVATTYHNSVASDFRNRKHRAQWLSSLENSLPATLLRRPISEISAADLLDVLLPLRDRVPETARRVRQRLDAVFSDAALRGLCAGNPAALIARRMRVKRTGEAPHLRALHYRDVPAFLLALRASDRNGETVKLAVEFAIITASRSGEVRGARWNEIDLKTRTWTIPADRMKGGETHRVHLSGRAMELLEAAKALRNDASANALVFPAPRDPKKPLSDMALTMALRRLPTGRTREDKEPETFGDLATLHGFRAAFSTWANDARTAHTDVIEAALAHREGDRVRAAYNRSAKEGERFERDLCALRLAWTDYVCAKRGKVVSIHGGKAALKGAHARHQHCASSRRARPSKLWRLVVGHRRPDHTERPLGAVTEDIAVHAERTAAPIRSRVRICPHGIRHDALRRREP